MPHKSRDYTSQLPQLRPPELSEDLEKSDQAKETNDQQQTFNYFEILSSDIFFELLEPPYDTLCKNRDPELMYTCTSECMIKQFLMINRVPGFHLLTHRFDKKVFSVKDLDHKERLTHAVKSFSICHRRCRFTPCKFDYSKTAARAMKDTSQDLRFSLLTSTDSTITITAQVTMSFIEYFSFVCGCFGTWFGFSFLSLNPAKIMGRRKRFRHTEAIRHINRKR